MKYDILREYLIHCYLYYTCDESIINDHEFDALCIEIRDSWDSLESPYKGLVLALEGGDVSRIKGTEVGTSCPPELRRHAMTRLEDWRAVRELFQ